MDLVSNYKKAKTAVFWDVVGCPIPDGLNAVEVSNNIRLVLKQMKVGGEVSICAYGDKQEILDGLNSPRVMVKNHKRAENWDSYGAASVFITSKLHGKQVNTQSYDELSPENMDVHADANSSASKQFVINHIPKEEQGAVKILHEIILGLFLWAKFNPVYSNIVIIARRESTAHQMFCSVLYRLCVHGYRVLLVQPQNATSGVIPKKVKVLGWESFSTGIVLPKIKNTNLILGVKSITFLPLFSGAVVWLAVAFPSLSRLVV